MRKPACIMTAFLMAACSSAPKTLTEQEIADIHSNEQMLYEQLVNATWHYEDEPSHAFAFRDDGTAEEYQGIIEWVTAYTFAVRFCDYEDKTGEHLAETDRESIEKYYDYNVVMQYTDPVHEGQSYIDKIAFDGDTLLMGVHRLVKGVDFLKTMPEGLAIKDELLNRVWYDVKGNDYRLFFPEGTGFRCNGVFLDGTLLNPEKFYWGTDNDMLYVMIPIQPGGEGPILEEVDGYRLEADGEGWQMTDYWSGQVRHYGIPGEDDDSAARLTCNYEKLHESMADWGY